MLEKLDDVPWSDLHHALGPADDVPAQLRALRSGEAGVREKALWNLSRSVFHEGTRYEASAAAVPFLLELVASPGTPARAALIELLVALAIGDDGSHLPSAFPIDELRSAAAGREALPVGGGRPDRLDALTEADQDRLQARIELNAYEAVGAGVPLFTALLSDGDVAVRRLAAGALGWFPGDDPAALTTSALTSVLADEDASVAATAAISLGLLGVAPEGALSDPRELVRDAAAIALATVHGRAAPRAVTERLLRRAGTEERTEVPYLDGDLSGYAARSLRLVLPDDTDEALDVLLTRIPAVRGPEALPVVDEALRWAFPGGPIAAGTPFGDLTERQRRVIRALAASPPTWQTLDRAVGDFLWLIGAYGLPRDAAGMRAYAGMASTP
ncbi:HEAT repeat domain-containing protein [Actinoplanes sp. M2I2]|uniref:HEAT repeat domain-containing protein n=1 Tax=Actinoplanes sp. M2I2 TaxID=1734444 RepID=UPI0020211671|nr:HEAT repeat domain-containing protein [Actinoplanes sp. M2I2]